MNSAPRSAVAPANGTDHTRPPTRSRASKTSTSAPASHSSSAAASPAKPAPTTITFTRLFWLDIPRGEPGELLPIAALVERVHEHAPPGQAKRHEQQAPERLAGDDERDDADQRDRADQDWHAPIAKLGPAQLRVLLERNLARVPDPAALLACPSLAVVQALALAALTRDRDQRPASD